MAHHRPRSGTAGGHREVADEPEAVARHEGQRLRFDAHRPDGTLP